jgi:hypothetical protein
MCSNEISFFRQHGVDRQEISMGFFTVGRLNPGDDHYSNAGDFPPDRVTMTQFGEAIEAIGT